MIDNKASTEDDPQLAPADTLLGQLQRGRGAGFLRALQEEPDVAHPLLVECITHDPRWDRQVETRSDYYARLCIATGLDLGLLREHLRVTPDGRHDAKTSQTVTTLGRLAELGDSVALEILRDYMSYGPLWDHALWLLAELSNKEATEGLADVVCARFGTGKEMDDSAVYDVLTPTLKELWQSWGETQPCIAKLAGEIHAIEAERALVHPHHSEPDYSVLTVEELLALAGRRRFIAIADQVATKARRSHAATLQAAFSQDNPFAWYAAMRGLQAIGLARSVYSRALDQAISHVERLPESPGPHITRRIAIRRMLMLLPSEMTLPLARLWFQSENWHKESVAGDLLEEHATIEDFPMVSLALTQHLKANPKNLDSYYTCTLLDILARFSDIGISYEVEKVFTDTSYSPARRRAARAMSANAPLWFAETYAYECLWDCEEETRQIGCESVSPAISGARERLQALADDPFESDLVRQAAATRISTS